MEDCEICIDVEGETKIGEGTTICKGCYDKVWNHLFQSDFNKEECIIAREEIETYHHEVTTLITKIRMIETDGLTIHDRLQEVIDMEKAYSELLYNKDRRCLSKMEHLKIIDMITEKLELQDISIKDSVGTNQIQELINKYLLNCSYLDANNW